VVEALSEALSEDAPLLVIAGPTASGKTALAMCVAERVGGEIVSCDSVAVYRLMDIGSAKPTAEERSRVRHHCVDIFWPDEPCTAGDYARAARAAIADIRGRSLLPIVVGGTGLYLRALLNGLAPAPKRDPQVRLRLQALVEKRGSAYVHRVLQRIDAVAAGNIHANDTPKLIRSIEVALAGGKPQTAQWMAGRDPLRGYRVLQVGLSPARAALYERINARAASMFARGLVAETEMLVQRFGTDCAALKSLGYAQALAVLRGEMSVEAAIRAAQQGHRNYAKRQLTWFRREADMHWLQDFGDQGAIQARCVELAALHLTGKSAGVWHPIIGGKAIP
jgi:tRNA dimethylallyltransferase